MSNSKPFKRICVYCASSQRCAPVFHEHARKLGELLARGGYEIVYGGGSTGSMGALADGALSRKGTVTGIIPEFMKELEWNHPGISELQIVENMRERKHLMLQNSIALVALPGGSGTLEELMEAITLKRLGIYLNPIIMVNTKGAFDPLVKLLERCISEQFMDERHRAMWQLVSGPEEVIEAVENAAPWSADSRKFSMVT